MYEEVMERVAQVIEERLQLGIECSEEETARLWYQVTLEVENEQDRVSYLTVPSAPSPLP